MPYTSVEASLDKRKKIYAIGKKNQIINIISIIEYSPLHEIFKQEVEKQISIYKINKYFSNDINEWDSFKSNIKDIAVKHSIQLSRSNRTGVYRIKDQITESRRKWKQSL